jgi:hypothetical protein
VGLTVLYKNNSENTVSDYTVSAAIPDGMSVADAGGARFPETVLFGPEPI